MWRRSLIIPAALLVYAVVLSYLSTLVVSLIGWSESGFDFRGPVSLFHHVITATFTGDWWLTFAPPVGMFIVTQIVFLVPYVRHQPIVRPDGRPLRRTILIAGLVAAVLTGGLVISVIQLQAMYFDWTPLTFDWFTVGWWVYAIIAISWAFWSVVLWFYTHRRSEDTRLSHWLGWLFAGTLIEFVAVLPIDVLVRRKTDCYCGTGTFYGLIVGVWALLWLAGPGTVLAICRHRRARFDANHCARCGYAKGPQPGERCPECGYAWLTCKKHAG